MPDKYRHGMYLTASGIHPSCPDDTRMEITSPVFDKIVFSLDPHYYSGKAFTIVIHHNNAKNMYIQKTLLNNKIYNKRGKYLRTIYGRETQ